MVSPYYYPPVMGGAEIAIENMVVSLNKLGVQADVMTFCFSGPRKPCWKRKTEKINEVKVMKIPAFGHRYLRALSMFGINIIPGRFANQFKNYDILHFHNDVDLTFPLLSYTVHKPKIFHCHCLATTYDSYKKNSLAGHIFRNVADIYITSSKSLVKLFENLGVPRTKIRVVHNGIDVERFQPRRENKIENLLLFVGRLDATKGLSVLFKSLNYLNTPIQLAIIGPSANPRYFEYILGLIEKANKKTIHKVMYLGALEQREVVEWFQKASVFVLPSVSESFGLVNLEALSCETPVVASNVGGISEVVRDQENGILVPPNDSVKLADGIQYLLDNKGVRQKFGEQGRRWVAKNFSSETMAENLLQIYEELM